MTIRELFYKESGGHIDVATSLNSLGELYSLMNKFELSENAYFSAIDIYRKLFGDAN